MIVTFYSFKGGVGRSLALVNIGEILAEMGYRVTMCDWDLEAPGLERYTVDDVLQARSERDKLLSRPGLMDLLQEYKQALSAPSPELTELPKTHAYAGKLALRRPSCWAVPLQSERKGPGTLSLLTAGRREGEWFQRYAEAVRTFNWDDFYENWAGDAYIEFMRQEMTGKGKYASRDAADIVLTDSRTGLTEQGGVCTHHLADLVVLLTAANDLNIEGTRWMATTLSDPRLVKMRGGRELRVLPVAARIEQTAQKDELAEFRNRFLREFGDLIGKTISDAEHFAMDSEIPYIPFYSFYERVAAREPEQKRDKRLYAAYEAIANGIVGIGMRASLLREPALVGRVMPMAVPGAPVAKDEPAWEPQTFIAELKNAISSGAAPKVNSVCSGLVARLESSGATFPEDEALLILTMLRRESYFDLVSRLADCLVRNGVEAPRIRRAYVQSLVDKGDLSSALITIQSLLTTTRRGSPDYLELRMLTGRVHKLQYTQSAGSGKHRSLRDLQHALNAYHEVYSADRNRYLGAGANCVALLARAERDRLQVEGFPAMRSLAQEIAETSRERTKQPNVRAWDYAIAAEVEIGLGDLDEASRSLAQFVESPADTFALQSMLQQLIDVWELDRSIPQAARMLKLLESRLLSRGVSIESRRGRGDGMASVRRSSTKTGE